MTEKVYQPSTSFAKDEKGGLLAEFHSMLSRSVTECNYMGLMFRQTEILAVEPLVPEPIVFEFEMAVEKLKRSWSNSA
jgi:hypothetical protein